MISTFNWLGCKGGQAFLFLADCNRSGKIRYRPYLTSPFKGRNKNLSQFGS